jgi:hypothetical protein
MSARPRSEAMFLATCESKDKRRKVENEDEYGCEGMALDVAGMHWSNQACRGRSTAMLFPQLCEGVNARRRVSSSRAPVASASPQALRSWAGGPPGGNVAADAFVSEM